jgi:formylglycine-generating enzyme required for sulfatase activity
MKTTIMLVLAFVWCAQAGGVATTQPTSQPAKEIKLDLDNNVSLQLVLIPGGKFLMGSPEAERGRRKNEVQHAVTISKPFYMGVTPVTVSQFAAFVKDSGYQTDAEKDGKSSGVEFKNGKLITYKQSPKMKNGRLSPPKKTAGLSWRDPSFDQKGGHPVVQVSWNDACAFCEWLSKRTGMTVALPTEAQWEYACRAGTKTACFWGDDPAGCQGWANVADQSLKRMLPSDPENSCVAWDDGFVFTSPAGSFKANAFGLFDMIGNVAQWCKDRYGDYGTEPATDPMGGIAGNVHIVRGASWNSFSQGDFRSACRSACFATNYRNERYGFRIVSELSEQSGGGDGIPQPHR